MPWRERSVMEQREELSKACQDIEPDERKIPWSHAPGAKSMYYVAFWVGSNMLRHICLLPSTRSYLGDIFQESEDATGNRECREENADT